MRDRARLAEVMRTVNPDVVGVTLAMHFRRAAKTIDATERANKVAWHMAGYAANNSSPHIRELATEWNTYVILDGLEA